VRKMAVRATALACGFTCLLGIAQGAPARAGGLSSPATESPAVVTQTLAANHGLRDSGLGVWASSHSFAGTARGTYESIWEW
jgi:hypothetical protein